MDSHFMSHVQTNTCEQARKRMLEQDNSASGSLHTETEHDYELFSSTVPDDGIVGTEPLQSEHCDSPQITSNLFRRRSEKHVSFSDQVQVQMLQDTDAFTSPGNHCMGREDSDDAAVADNPHLDEEDSSLNAVEGRGILTESKSGRNLEMLESSSLPSRSMNTREGKASGPRLRRSKPSVRKLRVEDLPRREEDLENMSPIELEDIDMEMAERLGGHPSETDGSTLAR